MTLAAKKIMGSTWLVGTVLLFRPVGSVLGMEVFQDRYAETEALEIWRITADPTIRHHSDYHNVDPFSPDGRYILYTITHPPGLYTRRDDRKPLATFCVYDLHARKEVYRASGPAVYPIWARTGDTVYFIKGASFGADRTLCHIDVTSKIVLLCDDRRRRKLAGAVQTISFDDRALFSVGPVDWRDPHTRGEWVIWRVEPDSAMPPSVFYRHAAFPRRITYEPRANPRLPYVIARQALLESAGKGVRRKPDHPARVLLGLDGTYLGALVPDYEKPVHICWSGDGRLVVRGDGPLRGRPAPFVEPGDWTILSTRSTSDPSPCGASGQWLVGIHGYNGRIFVADTRTAYTRTICYAASVIQQPKTDRRDLSGPYDSDSHGSPDGTKIYFSTNYDLQDHPITTTVSRVRRHKDGTGPASLDVASTKGFPSSGVLSVWSVLVKYKDKEGKRFLDCEWGYGNTRLPVAIDPGVLVTDYRGRLQRSDPKDPLAHQAATDVYIAVVRKPDAPQLASEKGGVVCHPGFNHRETASYRLYRDGVLDREVLAKADSWPVTISTGGKVAMSAVEWSGLESKRSAEVSIRAGDQIAFVDVSLTKPKGAKPDQRIMKNGRLIEARYLSPNGWPCQVLAYRADESLASRKLFRGPSQLASLETFNPQGRREEETLYNQEGNILEWTRFERGRAVERKVLRYGFYELHEKMVHGRWTKVSR